MDEELKLSLILEALWGAGTLEKLDTKGIMAMRTAGRNSGRAYTTAFQNELSRMTLSAANRVIKGGGMPFQISENASAQRQAQAVSYMTNAKQIGLSKRSGMLYSNVMMAGDAGKGTKGYNYMKGYSPISAMAGKNYDRDMLMKRAEIAKLSQRSIGQFIGPKVGGLNAYYRTYGETGMKDMVKKTIESGKLKNLPNIQRGLTPFVQSNIEAGMNQGLSSNMAQKYAIGQAKAASQLTDPKKMEKMFTAQERYTNGMLGQAKKLGLTGVGMDSMRKAMNEYTAVTGSSAKARRLLLADFKKGVAGGGAGYVGGQLQSSAKIKKQYARMMGTAPAGRQGMMSTLFGKQGYGRYILGGVLGGQLGLLGAASGSNLGLGIGITAGMTLGAIKGIYNLAKMGTYGLGGAMGLNMEGIKNYASFERSLMTSARALGLSKTSSESRNTVKSLSVLAMGLSEKYGAVGNPQQMAEAIRVVTGSGVVEDLVKKDIENSLIEEGTPRTHPSFKRRYNEKYNDEYASRVLAETRSMTTVGAQMALLAENPDIAMEAMRAVTSIRNNLSGVVNPNTGKEWSTEEIGATLVKTGQMSPAELEDLSKNARRISQYINNYTSENKGAALPEALGAYTMLTKAGYTPMQAGTSMVRSKSDILSKAKELAGISTLGFKNVEELANMSPLKIMAKISEALDKEMTPEQQKNKEVISKAVVATIFPNANTEAFMGLISTPEQRTALIEMVKGLSDSTEILKDFRGQLVVAGNSLENRLASASNAIKNFKLEVVASISQPLTAILGSFTRSAGLARANRGLQLAIQQGDKEKIKSYTEEREGILLDNKLAITPTEAFKAAKESAPEQLKPIINVVEKFFLKYLAPLTTEKGVEAAIEGMIKTFEFASQVLSVFYDALLGLIKYLGISGEIPGFDKLLKEREIYHGSNSLTEYGVESGAVKNMSDDTILKQKDYLDKAEDKAKKLYESQFFNFRNFGTLTEGDLIVPKSDLIDRYLDPDFKATNKMFENMSAGPRPDPEKLSNFDFFKEPWNEFTSVLERVGKNITGTIEDSGKNNKTIIWKTTNGEAITSY